VRERESGSYNLKMQWKITDDHIRRKSSSQAKRIDKNQMKMKMKMKMKTHEPM